MATEAQVGYIERLMRERDIGNLYQSVEAQTIRSGLGSELRTGQASRFITELRSLPMATIVITPKFKVGAAVQHKKFGKGTILQERRAGIYDVAFPVGEKIIQAAWLEEIRTAYSTVAEAIAAGLFHPNCTHDLGIWLEGITEPIELIPVAERRDNYQEKQAQRHNERMIRQWKRREAAATLDPQALTYAKAKREGWQARQREFVKESGRGRDYGRERITTAR